MAAFPASIHNTAAATLGVLRESRSPARALVQPTLTLDMEPVALG